MKTVTKIIVMIVISTGLSASSMCNFHINNAAKSMELASMESDSMYVYRIKASVRSLIEAKYACPKSYTKKIQKRIDIAKRLL